MRVLVREIPLVGSVCRLVVECPPARRLVRVINREAARTYRVPVPYTVFNIRLRDGRLFTRPRVFWRPQPTRTVNDWLYATWFTNVSRKGYACLPDSTPAPTPDEAVANVVNRFWQSAFNFDQVEQANPKLYHAKEEYYQNWQNWAGPLDSPPVMQLRDTLNYPDPHIATEFVGIETP